MTALPASLPARVGGLFASHFLGFGLFLPFFPMVLESRGLSVEDIGFILGAGTIARIAANPVMTGLSDHSGRRRLSIFIYSAIAASFLGLFSIFDSPLGALVCVVGLMAFWAPIVPLSDAYALDVVRNHGADYGRMRLWGSIAFVVANLAGGWLTEGGGNSNLILAGVALGAFSTGFVALSLPGQKSKAAISPVEEDKKPVLLAKPWFWLALGVLGLLQGSHAAFYGFGSLFWLEAGIGEFQIGILWSIGVIAEIGLFFMAGRIGLRLGPLTMLLIGALAGVVRWGLFPFADSFVSAAVLQSLHGLSFGAAHLGAVGYVSKLFPEKWAATGQGFLAASNGILTALGFAVCGPLFALDHAYAFWAMAALSAFAVIMLTMLRPFLTGKLAAAA